MLERDDAADVVDGGLAPTGMCVVRVWCSGEGLLIRVVSMVDVGSAGLGPGGGDRAAADGTVRSGRLGGYWRRKVP
jgi:hypothetical protein